jgi:cytochrome c-type biogenesis protein
MNKLLAVIVVSLFFVSCSKKQTTTNQPPKQQNQTQQQTNNQTTSGKTVYALKDVSPAGKNEMVDFSWNENGKDVKLSDYKGKVILVNFWATWCGPCKRELPALSQIANELRDKDFKMVGVSVDDRQSDVNSFLQVNNLSYTILHQETQLAYVKYMEVTGQNQNVVPQTYIIDKKGKVVETILGSRSKEDFLSIINKYL